MGKFRKRSTEGPDDGPASAAEIEAVRLTWRSWNEVCELVGDTIGDVRPAQTINLYTLLELGGDACGEAGPGFLALDLLTGHGHVAQAVHGDWIIAEPQPGRFRPVKPAAFVLLYEAVEEARSS